MKKSRRSKSQRSAAAARPVPARDGNSKPAAKQSSAFATGRGRHRHSLGLSFILLLAFGLRLSTVVWLSDTHPHSDYLYYHFAGEKIAEDITFFFQSEQAQYYGKFGWWPPIYPFVIGAIYSIFGVEHRIVVYLQVILGALLCWIVYAVGRRAGGERVGLLAGLIVALNPTYIFATNLLASENVFVIFLSLGLLMTLRTPNTPRTWMITGAFFAWGALTRAIGLLVPVVVALWSRRRATSRRAWLRSSFFLLLTCGLIIAPWTLRNWMVVGSPALVCFGGGLNFYYGHNAVHVGYRDLQQTPMSTLTTQQAIDQRGYRLGWQYIFEEPLGFFTRGAQKVRALFASPGYAPHSNSAIVLPDGWQRDPVKGRIAQELRARQRQKNVLLDGIFTDLATWFSYALLLFAVASLVFWKRMSDGLKLLVYLSAYWIVAHVFFWAQPRFRYPMEIFLAILAAFFIERLWVRYRTRQT